jgi:hypothetical protein
VLLTVYTARSFLFRDSWGLPKNFAQCGFAAIKENQKANPHGRMAAQAHENAGRGAGSGAGAPPHGLLPEGAGRGIFETKGKNLCAGPRAGLGKNLHGLAAIKTTVNDSILERRRKLATSRNLRGARRNGTLVVLARRGGFAARLFGETEVGRPGLEQGHGILGQLAPLLTGCNARDRPGTVAPRRGSAGSWARPDRPPVAKGSGLLISRILI